jgi:nucleoside-diphosphate-sugar epimerase
MACLVIGGTGFIGSYVVRDLLHQGKDVVCFQRSGVTPVSRLVIGEDKLDKVKMVRGDVTDNLPLFHAIQEHGIDMVVHVGASFPFNGESETQPAYALRVNCVGLNNILEAARLFGLRKVIWTSSVQVMGQLAELYKEPVGDDNAIYMPNTMYSATKVLNEFMTRLYFKNFGVDGTGFRIGFTFGVNQEDARNRVFVQFLKDAATNVPVTLATTDADMIRALCYVENISDLIVKACDAPTTRTRTFNAVEFQCSARQLVEIIRKVNPQAQVTIKEGVAIEAATWAGTPEPVLDTTGVRTELGWQPKYSFEEAITRIFNYFRQQKGLPLL